MSRRLRLAVLCAAVMTVIVASANVAVAKSVTCDEAGNCIVRCSQTLTNGTFIEYDEGTEITVTDAQGTTRKFKCQNGQWVQQATAQYPGSDLSGAGNFGTITETTIGPVKIAALTVDVGLFDLKSRSWRRPDFGGCDPNTVGCPG